MKTIKTERKERNKRINQGKNLGDHFSNKSDSRMGSTVLKGKFFSHNNMASSPLITKTLYISNVMNTFNSLNTFNFGLSEYENNDI